MPSVTRIAEVHADSLRVTLIGRTGFGLRAELPLACGLASRSLCILHELPQWSATVPLRLRAHKLLCQARQRTMHSTESILSLVAHPGRHSLRPYDTHRRWSPRITLRSTDPSLTGSPVEVCNQHGYVSEPCPRSDDTNRQSRLVGMRPRHQGSSPWNTVFVCAALGERELEAVVDDRWTDPLKGSA